MASTDWLGPTFVPRGKTHSARRAERYQPQQLKKDGIQKNLDTARFVGEEFYC